MMTCHDSVSRNLTTTAPGQSYHYDASQTPVESGMVDSWQSSDKEGIECPCSQSVKKVEEECLVAF